jgi:hypothetical protein
MFGKDKEGPIGLQMWTKNQEKKLRHLWMTLRYQKDEGISPVGIQTLILSWV